MGRSLFCKYVPVALAFATAAFSQTLPNGVQRVTSVEGITEYSLANGLHVLVFPDPSKSTITVNMTYLVGSRQEGSGNSRPEGRPPIGPQVSLACDSSILPERG